MGWSWSGMRIGMGACVGVALGLGGYTFLYAKGTSYLTNDPAACANCHVMNDQYSAWLKSSHRAVAVCNDCHTPHSMVGKYLTKMENGFRHSTAFTMGWFPEPIRITAGSAAVAEANCRRCHSDVVQAIEAPGEPLPCARCHLGVGHAD